MSQDRRPPVLLDMTPEGEFRDPPRGSWLDRALARVGSTAAVIALGAGGLAMALLAFVFLWLLIPLALLAGGIAWLTLRWRAKRGGRPVVFVVRR